MTFDGRARACIDLRALRANFETARRLAGSHGRVMAVIKANAYGHGLVPVAEALDRADLLAVTDLREARELAAAGCDKPVLILQGLIDRGEIRAIAEAGFQLVVHSRDQLAMLDEALTDTRPEYPLTFWLKLDSGMGRLGIGPADFPAAYRRLAGRPFTDRVILMTHLANSSLPDSPLNRQQLEAFEAATRGLEAAGTSIPASTGLIGGYGIVSDWARPGIMLYGSSPFPPELEQYRADAVGLEPVMTFQSKIIAVKDLPAGSNVGYCSQFICPRDMRIGIASVGYADGYPSNAPNGTPVLVGGRRSETVGRVSMDMLAVDLSHLPATRPGDPVTLWGRGLPIDEIAAATGIISYNLMCSVTRRVQFSHG